MQGMNVLVIPRPHDGILMTGGRPNQSAKRLTRGDTHTGTDTDLVQAQNDPPGSLDGWK